MNVDLGIWAKLTRVVIFLLVVAAVLGVGVWYLPLIRQNQRMRQEIMVLEAEIKKQEEISRHLDATIRALRSDPKTVERLAREKLGYAKPGETVIYFDGSTNNPPVK